MPHGRDPQAYREEAAQLRGRASAATDSARLRDSYLALAIQYERLANVLEQASLPPAAERPHRTRPDPIAVLRLALLELRDLADRNTDIRSELRRIADQLETRLADMEPGPGRSAIGRRE